jgi:DNA-binding PadR family transcriptional regulator
MKQSLNELKQEILGYLIAAESATARTIAEDLLYTDKADKNRLNKCLTELKKEGLIEAERFRDEDAGMTVNTYRVTEDGLEAYEPPYDPEVTALSDAIESQPQNTPPITAHESEYDDLEDTDYDDDILTDLDDEDGYLPESIAKIGATTEQRLNRYMLVVDGESLIYDSAHEAQDAAREFAKAVNTKVDYYTLTAQHIGAFAPVTRVEFIGAQRDAA